VKSTGNVLAFLPAPQEAEFSSRIEQTYAAVCARLYYDLVDDVADASPNVLEVENNYRLLLFANKTSKSRILTLSVLKQMHELLFRGIESRPKVVGDFRKVQNWIGSSNNVADARYVPPQPVQVVECLESFIQFVNHPPSLPLLVRTAMLHYQFEAIHPFDDGNGRIGRGLILWQLVADGAIDLPLLNPSAQLEAKRREYYDLILEVTLKGQWHAWIEYFCQCVTRECYLSIEVVKSLTRLRAKYHDSIRQARKSAILAKLIDRLLGDPAVTLRLVGKMLQVTPSTAQRAIDALVQLKILVEVTGGQRNRVYLAEEIVNLFSRHSLKSK
jgi:Fic family protein